MKKLTLAALIASTLLITACDQSSDVDVTDTATETGSTMMDNATEMVEQASETVSETTSTVVDAVEATTEIAADAVESGSEMIDSTVEVSTKSAGDVADSASEVAGEPAVENTVDSVKEMAKDVMDKQATEMPAEASDIDMNAVKGATSTMMNH